MRTIKVRGTEFEWTQDFEDTYHAWTGPFEDVFISVEADTYDNMVAQIEARLQTSWKTPLHPPTGQDIFLI